MELVLNKVLGRLVFGAWWTFKSGSVQEFLGGLASGDLALSLLWLRFSPWLGNFWMPQAWPKIKRGGAVRVGQTLGCVRMGTEKHCLFHSLLSEICQFSEAVEICLLVRNQDYLFGLGLITGWLIFQKLSNVTA